MLALSASVCVLLLSLFWSPDLIFHTCRVVSQDSMCRCDYQLYISVIIAGGGMPPPT